MTKDDVTRMAHEAAGFDGTTSLERPVVLYAAMSKDFLDKFAALVAAQEREACAEVCLKGTDMPVQVDALKIIRAERERISKAIRERGNHD